MSDNLYNDAIVAAAKAKIGAGRLTAPTASADCDNPLCGDRITLDLDVHDGRIAAVGHKTRGCLLTQASASVIARHAINKSPAELAHLREQVAALLRGEPISVNWPELAMFLPVAAVKSRHECVLLPFQALADALAQVPDDAMR